MTTSRPELPKKLPSARTLVEESRTHETPLVPTTDRFVRGSAIELLGRLTPLNALEGDGLRFVARRAQESLQPPTITTFMARRSNRHFGFSTGETIT